MLTYNWSKIFRVANKNPKQVLLIFDMLVGNKIPYSHRDPIYKYSQMDFSGISFLLHANRLLYEAYKYTYKDVALYIALASRRSLAEYKVNNTLSLDANSLSRDPRVLFNNPDLLKIENGVLHFRYEEPELFLNTS
jgi:hypothetical protein